MGKYLKILSKEKPTNNELTYILEYCNDETLRNRAGEMLKEQKPTNNELTYILEYCNDETLRNRAGEMLKEQKPTNNELTYILRWCNDETLRNRAGEMLKEQLGLKDIVLDEKALIKKIAEAVLSRPGCLKMDEWHCGTSHCLAGWACVIDPIAMQVERDHNTRIAGSVVLPNYAHLFYSDNETVIKALEQVAKQ